MMTFFEDITDIIILPHDEILKSERITWFRFLNDFNLPIGFPRIEYDSGPCLSGYTWTLIKINSIIGVASMSYTDRVNICLFNGKINPFGLSAQFFINNRNKVLFEDITLQINRDKKINQIL